MADRHLRFWTPLTPATPKILLAMGKGLLLFLPPHAALLLGPGPLPSPHIFPLGFLPCLGQHGRVGGTVGSNLVFLALSIPRGTLKQWRQSQRALRLGSWGLGEPRNSCFFLCRDFCKGPRVHGVVDLTSTSSAQEIYSNPYLNAVGWGRLTGFSLCCTFSGSLWLFEHWMKSNVC